MINISNEEYQKLLAIKGKTKDRIEFYWKLQEMKEFYQHIENISNNGKNAINQKIDELSILICDELLGKHQKQ